MFGGYQQVVETEDEAPKDPRTEAEDQVLNWLEHADDFQKATMLFQLNRLGWTCEKALAVRSNIWRKAVPQPPARWW